jgi:hypothetical protein
MQLNHMCNFCQVTDQFHYFALFLPHWFPFCTDLWFLILSNINPFNHTVRVIINDFVSFFFYVFFSLFICTYIVWVIYTPCPSPPPSSPTPLTSRQNLFCPFLQFCWRVDISKNKKDILFLLVWDKDSYTERFLAFLLCTSVLQPEFIHLSQTSSLLLGHLPILTSVILRLLY